MDSKSTQPMVPHINPTSNVSSAESDHKPAVQKFHMQTLQFCMSFPANNIQAHVHSRLTYVSSHT